MKATSCVSAERGSIDFLIAHISMIQPVDLILTKEESFWAVLALGLQTTQSLSQMFQMVGSNSKRDQKMRSLNVFLSMLFSIGLAESVYSAAMPETCPGALGAMPLVEFHDAKRDHYFYTHPCVIGEIDAVDRGLAGPDWRRTGWKFGVFTVASAGPVNRFYGSVTPGPNSHFYTINGSETDKLLELFKNTPANQPRWGYEGGGNFGAFVSLDGTTCGPFYPTTPPLIRFYNRGFELGKDPNHRFVPSTATEVIAEMKTKGWAQEGIAFCISEAQLNGVTR
jgi:hypothetical protein